jgi:hypothetical protein
VGERKRAQPPGKLPSPVLVLMKHVGSPAGGPDMGNLGVMASELAKQRQRRIQDKRKSKEFQPRSMYCGHCCLALLNIVVLESATLTKLLSELDQL